MANIISGTHDSMDTGWSTPISDRPCPSWNTNTTTPKAAPTDSKFMIAACSGTNSDLNSIISRMNEMRMTTPMNHGRRAATLAASSAPTAVVPVTYT